MTDLLERAMAEVAKLSPKEQDQVARWLLDELASDAEWDGRFSATSDALERLAREALDEHRAGATKDLDDFR